jgi:urea carboxylase
MEGPGGYQFVGRTLQMWNRHRRTQEFAQPWLLRFFDQIRFFEVDAEELARIRLDFPRGRYPLRIEQTRFNLQAYRDFLDANDSSIRQFTEQRQAAFALELQDWRDSGQFHFDSVTADNGAADQTAIPAGCVAIDSPVAGNIWKLKVKPGEAIRSGQVIAILESMKMEIDVHATVDGVVHSIQRNEGSQIGAGQTFMVIRGAAA